MPPTDDVQVVVPASLAAATFTALTLYLQASTSANGGALTPEARALLRDLHRAASGASSASTSSQGSHVDASEILGAHEVADLLGCTRRWATVLLSSGRLDSRRVGRTWVTTRGDLDRYRYEEAPHGEAREAGEGGRGADERAAGPEAA